jgi:LysM repeat protein
MNNPVARGVLIGVIVALIVGSVAGCMRSKPERLVAPRPTTGEQALAPESSPTALIALPVVGGVNEAQDSTQVLSTPTEIFSTPTAEPTMALPEPTATVATPQPTLAPSGDITYTVRTGDTLLSIAIQFNTTKQAIMDRNGLRNPDLIRVGQTLIIPVGYVPTGTPAPMTVQHTVKAGETLSSIARAYYTTAAAILSENPSIQDAEHLSVGAVLTVTWGSEPAVRTHRVQVGETLSSIAAKYGLTTAELARANGLANPNLVYVGQRLIIPS